MTTRDMLKLPNSDILAYFAYSGRQYLLTHQKTTGSYQLSVVDTKTGVKTVMTCFETIEQASSAYVTWILTILSLDPQLLIGQPTDTGQQSSQEEPQHVMQPERGTFSLTASGTQNAACLSASKKQQSQIEAITPETKPLHPSVFYNSDTIPEWLVATKSFLDLNSGTSIVKDEHYKLVALNLKRKLNSSDSIIHLQDRHGKLIALTLTQTCQSFAPGRAQNWKSRTPGKNSAKS